ncbi:helix-turn-helix transcriptional regulator [Tahibacter soli]|uniref:Helix-turn-helix domain-containing protein n=1 Tax=Tahibacter soli TaxID=2983605 RepID=A0A9X3YNA1_9GAMM|nr:helix-turn-helix domain-containing protein [Tahibacter soli]MDC8013883.1 helix-turn-helix domain-containing protein [Tahibacter soli]
MSTIHELGRALKTRRTEMGLTQAQVASLAGLSRQTINEVETGAVADLGLNKAERLASALGLGLQVVDGRVTSPPRRRLAPLARAAATASVSYRKPITAARLTKILATGMLPTAYEPHLHALLDDAPVSLLAGVVDQLREELRVERGEIWANYRELARQVKSLRDIWQ